MVYSNTWATVDLDAIEHNFHKISQKAKTPVCAVIKADAYGHGAIAVARLLEGQCAFFAVSSVAEALELRNAGIKTPVLLLGNVSAKLYPAVIAHDIRPAISCMEDAIALSQEAARQNRTAYAHLAVDTGMSRIGFQVTEESADQCAEIGKLPNIQVEGLFSHFATADEEDLSAAQAQAELFNAFYRMLQARDMQIPLRHLDNSAGILNFDCHYNMVRAGIVLYGLYPSPVTEKALPGLLPAMGWETAVTQVKLLEPGRKIGYGGTHTVDKPTMVATVPVGYADGYRRSLSGSFYVLIRNQKAPILGRICMDQLMVDVTHIPDVKSGDRVVLMGTDGELTISAETLGAAAHSFNYEQVCDVGRRVTRVYYHNGQKVHTVNYLLNK